MNDGLIGAFTELIKKAGAREYTFTASGLFYVPQDASMVLVEMYGGGGGGGGGAQTNTATASLGGSGGGGAAVVLALCTDPKRLAPTVQVVVAAGGVGQGPRAAGANFAVSNATDGGDTAFGSYLIANGGNAGEPGTGGTGTVNSPFTSVVNRTGSNGGTSSLDLGAVGGASGNSCAGGAAAPGTNSSRIGHVGGASVNSPYTSAGGTAGAINGGAGGNGDKGILYELTTASTDYGTAGAGGGSSGSSVTGAAIGVGGDGGFPGGGGGGTGSVSNGQPGIAKAGNGGNGLVRVFVL